MSQEQAKSRRTIEERASVRWPSLARLTTRSVLGLQPGSRIRRAVLRRAARNAFDVWNRADFELVPIFDDPEVETRITQGGRQVPGLDAVYYGPEGHCRSMELWNEAWGKWEADIDDVIEEGRDRVLVIARVHAEGAASGIAMDEWAAVRYSFREGRIVRVDAAADTDRARALAALPEAADHPA
jgi:hypothetical protein